MDLWSSILLKWLQSVSIIYFDAQIISDLVNSNSFKPAPVSFGHVSIIFLVLPYFMK